MMQFIYEALKTAGALVIVGILTVCYLLIAGCASREGDGFENTGRHARPVVCRETQPGYTQCRSE